MSTCPHAIQEFKRIRAAHATLASSGCTKDLCQAGRLIHTDEPRVGENRSLQDVEEEAQSFLAELHREGLYKDESELHVRLEQVLQEIRAQASEGVVRGQRHRSMIGGTWAQTKQELEFGIRRAWQNSRKCIMRSHCEELKLCDLRNVTSSKQMATDLISNLEIAFNQGNIQPTVFVFPPRTVNGRGPMILNNQILQFCGYEDQDGSVLGDPMNVELTRTIIDLGWQPPMRRSRWDLLPLVTMAEDDRPFVIELPASISETVRIRHPKYKPQFEELDLRWSAFPALTRLGFDIGGVQYTAAPFIGWFMDAEIGVRNLADTFRYNVLPDVVKALGLADESYSDGIEEFDDLPEYEKLAMLSRAQAELNYAVHHSYLQAKISMSDSLTASKKWCQYDDAFREKNGFRLPADPYWLAPPQGSIIPVWHRGGAPNYQPKPMISKHVNDPIKVWAREKHRWPAEAIEISYTREKTPSGSPEIQVLTPIESPGDICEEFIRLPTYDECSAPVSIPEPIIMTQIPKSISIYFCSAGTIAEKLALKLHKWMKMLALPASNTSLESHIRPLNNLTLDSLNSNKILLLIVSTTGQGDVPNNGASFLNSCTRISPESQRAFHFATFGNGDSRYSNTFNGAAIKTDRLLRKIGGTPLAGGLFQSDIAVEPLPLRALKAWCTKLEPYIVAPPTLSLERPSVVAFNKFEKLPSIEVSVTQIQDGEEMSPVDRDVGGAFDEYQKQLLSTLEKGTVTALAPDVKDGGQRTRILTVHLAGRALDEMSCIQILPLNAKSVVDEVLIALQVDGNENVANLGGQDMTYGTFLADFVDLESPFSNLEWLSVLKETTNPNMYQDVLSKTPVRAVLQLLHKHAPPLFFHQTTNLRQEILLAMPLLRPRTYSIASSQHYHQQQISNTSVLKPVTNKIDIMVKTIPRGRFSTTYLQSTSLPSALKYRIVDSVCGAQIRSNHLAPFVIMATGAGFGPVRCLLQWRIALAREAIASGKPLPGFESAISLFLGFKACDLELVRDILDEAKQLFLVDVLEIVLSNPQKRRAYHCMREYGQEVRVKLLENQGLFFTCTNREAAEETKRILSDVLGISLGETLGQRYVEEIF